MNAMIIDPKDNVAVAIEPIAAGETVTDITCPLARRTSARPVPQARMDRRSGCTVRTALSASPVNAEREVTSWFRISAISS